MVYPVKPDLPPGAVGKFILGMLAEVAALEAGLIADRTRAAMSRINATIAATGSYTARSGRVITRLGADEVPAEAATRGQERSREVRAAKADRFAADVAPAIVEIEAGGTTTLGGLARALNAMGIQTSKGAKWTPTSVARVRARITA